MASATILLRILLMGCLPSSNAEIMADMVEYVDSDGDNVAFKKEDNGIISLYGNGDLLMQGVILVRRVNNTLYLVAPDAPDGDSQHEAHTTIQPGQEDRLDRILAMLSPEERQQDAAVVDTQALGEAAESLSVGTLLAYRDVDGDDVEIKRDEGGWLNLYGNGQLALEKIYLTRVEGRTLFLRSFPAAQTSHLDGETTIPEGQDDVLERAKAILQEQMREKAGFLEPWRTRETEEFIAAVNMIAAEAEAARVRAAEPTDAGVEDRAPRSRRSDFFIDLGNRPEEAALAPAVVTEAQRGIVAREPYRSILDLNRFNFHANILQDGGGDAAEHWIVLFCYNWWQPCQQIKEPYAQMATEWQGKLNKALFTQTVRFAQVDCATDRVLCNERNVEGLPDVQHYTKGALSNKWSGGRANDELRLAKWLKKRLDSLIAPEYTPPGKELSFWPLATLPGSRLATDMLIVVAILALNLWAVCSNPSLARAPTKAAEVQGPDAAELRSR